MNNREYKQNVCVLFSNWVHKLDTEKPVFPRSTWTQRPLHSCRGLLQTLRRARTNKCVWKGKLNLSRLEKVTDHGQSGARRSQPVRTDRRRPEHGSNDPPTRTGRRDRSRRGVSAGAAAMVAALLLRDARRDNRRPALIGSGFFKSSRPQAGGLFLSVSLHNAFADPLLAGEDLLPKEVFPRSACGVSSCFLPVGLHRAADPDRKH